MEIRVVETESDFDTLEGEWNRLLDLTSSSFFSSFDYVRTTWKHFHKPTDRLFILTLYEGRSIVGIAPFYIKQCQNRGIPYRTIAFIAEWEGDRPAILANGNRKEVLSKIVYFCDKNRDSWEVIDLIEQPAEGPDGQGWSFLSRPGWHWESQPAGVDYYVSLKDNWENYLNGLRSKTRHEWRRKVRRFCSIPEGYTVERVSDPARMKDALCRFSTIEGKSWKKQAGLGVAKDERHTLFYEDLLSCLAPKGLANVYFLVCNREDMAGNMIFIQKDVVYSRHLSYAEVNAAFSPGILLQAEVIKEHFGKNFMELDLLTMKENGRPPKHKSDWATGRRETIRWTGYRLNSRLFPLIVCKRFKSLFKKNQTADTELRITEPINDCELD